MFCKAPGFVTFDSHNYHCFTYRVQKYKICSLEPTTNTPFPVPRKSPHELQPSNILLETSSSSCMTIGSSSKIGLGIPESSRKKKKKTRKRSKKSQSKKEMTSVVQDLYETCREVFANGGAGYVPPPNDIDRLKSFLDGMRPEDVNLAPNMPFFDGTDNGEEAHRVTYIHIYECNKFSIGIFCLPPSAVIPLHDHPNMTVFSKLLFGRLRVKSYDWVDSAATGINENADQIRNQQQQRIRLAKVHIDSDFIAPCETSVLFPAAGGNMHCFRALTPCAILDVLGPPYSESEGRHCTYYQDFPFSRFPGTAELPQGEDKNEYAWLEDIEKPERFVVVGAIDHCPQILEH